MDQDIRGVILTKHIDNFSSQSLLSTDTIRRYLVPEGRFHFTGYVICQFIQGGCSFTSTNNTFFFLYFWFLIYCHSKGIIYKLSVVVEQNMLVRPSINFTGELANTSNRPEIPLCLSMYIHAAMVTHNTQFVVMEHFKSLVKFGNTDKKYTSTQNILDISLENCCQGYSAQMNISCYILRLTIQILQLYWYHLIAMWSLHCNQYWHCLSLLYFISLYAQCWHFNYNQIPIKYTSFNIVMHLI